MLQSEAQVLQFQRHFYEAALAQLCATPGYGSHARLQQQQLQQQQVEPPQQHQQQQHTWLEAEQLTHAGGDEPQQQQQGGATVHAEQYDEEGDMQQLQQMPSCEDRHCPPQQQVSRCRMWKLLML
jgi:hypothetical protein